MNVLKKTRMMTLPYRFFLLLSLFFLGCKQSVSTQREAIKIAVLSDVHLQAIYPDSTMAEFQGVRNPKTGHYNTIRTMAAQLRSTRLFNENYFALLAALDDLVSRNIKLVLLPGDFSDDGQPMNVKALRDILDRYAKTHQMTFLLTTGNHDPVRPFTRDAGKRNFLGKEGREQTLISNASMLTDKALEKGALATDGIKNWGYKDIIGTLSDFGFMPKVTFKYWETPFSSYGYENYSLEQAMKASKVSSRRYAISPNGQFVPDVSYMVEPVKGLWILALDANVYVPKNNRSNGVENPDDFQGAGTGYRNVLTHKKHLIPWVAKVMDEGKKRGKTVIAFSHYPMVEFNDGATREMTRLFGADEMQLYRVPPLEVAKTFADLGLQVHFGGHMHANDTGIVTTDKGNTLFNIQVPSLAAYPPAYKIATIEANEKIVIQTVQLDTVSNFDELFPLYEMEHAHLRALEKGTLWNTDMLNAKTYGAFAEWHLQELVRLRFLPEDWPLSFSDSLQNATGLDLLYMGVVNDDDKSLKRHLQAYAMDVQDFQSWTGFDMIYDFYRIKNADELAFAAIGPKRLKAYARVCEHLKNSTQDNFMLWGTIFDKMMLGAPADYFEIDLSLQKINALN